MTWALKPNTRLLWLECRFLQLIIMEENRYRINFKKYKILLPSFKKILTQLDIREKIRIAFNSLKSLEEEPIEINFLLKLTEILLKMKNEGELNLDRLANELNTEESSEQLNCDKTNLLCFALAVYIKDQAEQRGFITSIQKENKFFIRPTN